MGAGEVAQRPSNLEPERVEMTQLDTGGLRFLICGWRYRAHSVEQTSLEPAPS